MSDAIEVLGGSVPGGKYSLVQNGQVLRSRAAFSNRSYSLKGADVSVVSVDQMDAIRRGAAGALGGALLLGPIGAALGGVGQLMKGHGVLFEAKGPDCGHFVAKTSRRTFEALLSASVSARAGAATASKAKPMPSKTSPAVTFLAILFGAPLALFIGVGLLASAAECNGTPVSTLASHRPAAQPVRQQRAAPPVRPPMPDIEVTTVEQWLPHAAGGRSTARALGARLVLGERATTDELRALVRAMAHEQDPVVLEVYAFKAAYRASKAGRVKSRAYRRGFLLQYTKRGGPGQLVWMQQRGPLSKLYGQSEKL